MSRTSSLAQGFRDAWSHIATEPGWPANGSILWHIAHLIHCQERYARVIRQWGTPVESRTADFEPLNLEPLLKRLEVAHADLLMCIEGVNDDALETTTSSMTLQEFILMSTRHDTWHAAQIAMVRRLYAYSQR